MLVVLGILAEGTLQVSEVSQQQFPSTAPAQQPTGAQVDSSGSTATSSSAVPSTASSASLTSASATQAAALVKREPISDETLSNPRYMVTLPYPASYMSTNDRSSRLNLLATRDQPVYWLPFMGRSGLTKVLQAINELVVLSAVSEGAGVVRLADMRHPPIHASASATASGSAVFKAPSTPPALAFTGQEQRSQLLIYGTPGWGPLARTHCCRAAATARVTGSLTS